MPHSGGSYGGIFINLGSCVYSLIRRSTFYISDRNNKNMLKAIDVSVCPMAQECTGMTFYIFTLMQRE